MISKDNPNIKVSTIEDNKALRDGLIQLINSTPGLCVVSSFGDCEDLVNNLARFEMPDVILMDIDLPGINGVEGVKKVKAAFSKINIMMLTVIEDEQKIFDSVCAGASGYLLKKTPPRKIIDAIIDLHQGGSPMTPKIARKVLGFFQKSPNGKVTHHNLTSRETEILSYLVQGDTYKMIAEQCFISVATVQSHITSIYDKLHVHSKAEAVAKALKDRII